MHFLYVLFHLKGQLKDLEINISSIRGEFTRTPARHSESLQPLCAIKYNYANFEKNKGQHKYFPPYVRTVSSGQPSSTNTSFLISKVPKHAYTASYARVSSYGFAAPTTP